MPVTIDFSPFLAAAKLLYDGPWVAERYHVAGALIEQQPDAVLPVIRNVLQKAPAMSAVAAFEAQYQLQAYKSECDAILAGLECVLTPTYPRPVSLAELAEDRLQLSRRLAGHRAHGDPEPGEEAEHLRHGVVNRRVGLEERPVQVGQDGADSHCSSTPSRALTISMM